MTKHHSSASDSKAVATKPKQALNLYLEDLLLQVPEILEQEELVDDLVDLPKVEAAVEVKEHVESDHDLADEQISEKIAPVTSSQTQAPELEPSQELEGSTTDSPGDSGLGPTKAWQEEEFDCLLFQVAGLNLAIPMIMLGTIHTKSELTSLFGQPDWLLGLMKLSESSSLRLVDTARVFLEHRYQPEHSLDYRYAIGVYDSHWGLACHQVLGSKRIAKTQVKWREQRNNRPWLAGTIKDEMCALIDVQALCQFRLK